MSNSSRPYRKARSNSAACNELRANRGTQFDPDVVEVFASVSPERWEELREKVARMPGLRVRTLVLGDEPVNGRRNGTSAA